MKFMKLGTRPDTFYSADTSVRTIASEIPTDIAIQVDETVFLLHKFPLFSKCCHLKRVHHEIPQSGDLPLNLPDFPGGADAFELCAKFCYGVTITVSALNIVPARCAAEYLGMSDDDGEFGGGRGGGGGGNLTVKLDAFFISCILRRWRDTLVALQGTRRLPMWCEELGFTQRCVDEAAAAVVAYPSKISWGQHQAFSSSVSSTSSQKAKGWWAEDLAELGLDHFWRIMVAVKTSGRVPGRVVGDALQIYARRWLARTMSSIYQGKTSGDGAEDSPPGAALTKQKRVVLERIVSLLPAEKGSTSCGFLLRLLRAANLLDAPAATKKEVMRRIGLQLDEVSVDDLLRIPSTTVEGPAYDVDAVMTILEEFLLQGQHSPPAMSPVANQPPRASGRAAAVTGSRTANEQGGRHRRSRSAEDAAGLAESGGQDYGRWNNHRRSSSSSASTHGAKLRVAKLVDAYLLEAARDPRMPLGKLVSLAEMVPEFARPDHDDLYRVIDGYLKSHPDLSKSERKRLCRALDCKKLSVEACMDAAQNEKLPLRVVVQVLFFEQSHAQARAKKAARLPAQLPEKIEALLTAASSKPPPEIVVDYDDDIYSWSGAKCRDGGGARRLANGGNNVATLRMKLEEEEDEEEEATSVSDKGLAGGLAMMMRSSSSRFNKALCAIPGKPKRMLSRIWSINRSASQRR